METGAPGEQDRETALSARPGSPVVAAENAAGSGSAARTGGLAAQHPATGDARVDAALARLDELADLPVTEHREVFEHIHRNLTEVLGELETPGPAASPRGGRG
jgi:hypothetical protein